MPIHAGHRGNVKLNPAPHRKQRRRMTRNSHYGPVIPRRVPSPGVPVSAIMRLPRNLFPRIAPLNRGGDGSSQPKETGLQDVGTSRPHPGSGAELLRLTTPSESGVSCRCHQSVSWLPRPARDERGRAGAGSMHGIATRTPLSLTLSRNSMPATIRNPSRQRSSVRARIAINAKRSHAGPTTSDWNRDVLPALADATGSLGSIILTPRVF